MRRTWGTQDLSYSTPQRASWIAWWEFSRAHPVQLNLCPYSLVHRFTAFSVFNPQLKSLFEKSSIGPLYSGCRLILLRWELVSRPEGHVPGGRWPPCYSLSGQLTTSSHFASFSSLENVNHSFLPWEKEWCSYWAHLEQTCCWVCTMASFHRWRKWTRARLRNQPRMAELRLKQVTIASFIVPNS